MTTKKKIFVNGTFDVVHIGHLKLLNYAKSLGDYLMVAIDSDKRIRELKGETRPINNVYERKTLLLNLKSVDEVQVFSSNEEKIELLQAYKPDIIVKGSDHIHDSQIAKQYCKEVIFYDRFGEYSSSKKIEHIANR